MRFYGSKLNCGRRCRSPIPSTVTAKGAARIRIFDQILVYDCRRYCRGRRRDEQDGERNHPHQPPESAQGSGHGQRLRVRTGGTPDPYGADDSNRGVDDRRDDVEARVPRDHDEIPGDRDCVDAGHGQPGVPSGPGDQAVAGGREEGGAGDQEQGERGFVCDLCRDRPGDGGDVGVHLRHPEGRDPDGEEDVGGEEGEQDQEVGEVGGGRRDARRVLVRGGSLFRCLISGHSNPPIIRLYRILRITTRYTYANADPTESAMINHNHLKSGMTTATRGFSGCPRSQTASQSQSGPMQTTIAARASRV